MATEQQHANGALSDTSLIALLAKCSTGLHRCICNENNGIFLAREVDVAIAVLANRPASYTLEQIRAAAIKANWLNAGVEIIARLQPAPMPKPKTAEQRVIVNEGLSPNHNAVWVVQLDGENILYMRKDWYSREDAETFRIGKIVQLRKESEAHNG
jgi:hypothetical protein